MEQSPNTPTTDRRENDVDVAFSVVGEKGPRGEQGSTALAGLIADRAREIAASSRAGSDLDNWLSAEREVLTRSSAPTGERDAQGPTGEAGDEGAQGKQDDRGLTGLIGEQGRVGDVGDQGPVGERGEQGPRDEDGLPGARGEQGLRGEQRLPDLPGPVGPAGSAAAPEPQVIPGPRGPQRGAPEVSVPARQATGWTAPSNGAPLVVKAFNPFEAWITLLGNLAELQRKAWTYALGATGARRPNGR